MSFPLFNYSFTTSKLLMAFVVFLAFACGEKEEIGPGSFGTLEFGTEIGQWPKVTHMKIDHEGSVYARLFYDDEITYSLNGHVLDLPKSSWYLVNLNPDGSLVWSYDLEYGDPNSRNAIHVTQDQKVVYSTLGSYDITVLDNSGNLEVSFPTFIAPEVVTVASSGNVIAIGKYNGSSFLWDEENGVTLRPDANVNDYVLVAHSPDGSLLWNATISGASDIFDVEVSGDDQITFSGILRNKVTFYGADGVEQANIENKTSGDGFGFLVRYNSNGQYLWKSPTWWALGNGFSVKNFEIAIAEDGNIYTAASNASSTSNTHEDAIYIRKISRDGADILWEDVIQNPQDPCGDCGYFVKGFELAENGGVVLGAESAQFNVAELGHHAFIKKYTAEGSEVWTQRIFARRNGGEIPSGMSSLAVDPNGYIWAGGNFAGAGQRIGRGEQEFSNELFYGNVVVTKNVIITDNGGGGGNWFGKFRPN